MIYTYRDRQIQVCIIKGQPEKPEFVQRLVLLNGDIGAQSGDRSEPTAGDTKVVAKVMTT